VPNGRQHRCRQYRSTRRTADRAATSRRARLHGVRDHDDYVDARPPDPRLLAYLRNERAFYDEATADLAAAAENLNARIAPAPAVGDVGDVVARRVGTTRPPPRAASGRRCAAAARARTAGRRSCWT
jgi:hypothetical protein